MLKGLAITPPVLGRISIGKVVEKNGRRMAQGICPVCGTKVNRSFGMPAL